MTPRHRSHQSIGFTIVELMIAMAFISIMLLAIAAVVMQVAAIYNKGVMMKSVNQAGRQIVTDMKRSVGESPVLEDINGSFQRHDADNGSRPTPDYDAGRFCTGIYSYIWNIGKHIDESRPEAVVNKYGPGAGSDKQIRLVKVRDTGGVYCKGDGTSPIQTDGSTELLSEGNLAVQDFTVTPLTTNQATGMAMYLISVTISNADTDTLSTVDNRCKPPSEDSVAQNFCAVNVFDFTVRAGNKGGQ